jgi:DNA polymerase-1
MARIALIDGDVIVYKAAWAAEQAVEWEDGVHTLHVDPGTLAQIAETVLGQIERAIQPDKMIVTLSEPGRLFRHDVFEGYKANRKANRKPLAWKAARTYLEETTNAVWRPRLEADDVMGILATGHTKLAPASADRIVCSVDKDMRQVPGLHYDWTKDETVREVSALDADAFFYAQVLAGDATDGIPGIPGVGMVKATKMLAVPQDDPRTVWEVIREAYEKRGLSEEYALTMARLVRILRAEDYDFNRKEIRLWAPTAH